MKWRQWGSLNISNPRNFFKKLRYNIYVTQNVPFKTFLGIQVSGIKYLHHVVQPSPLVMFKTGHPIERLCTHQAKPHTQRH